MQIPAVDGEAGDTSGPRPPRPTSSPGSGGRSESAFGNEKEDVSQVRRSWQPVIVAPAHPLRTCWGLVESRPMSHTPQDRRIFVAQRPDPLPSAPVSLWGRFREVGGEALFASRRLVRDLLSDWKRRDPAFRWKTGIVAAWLGISLVSLHVATSGPSDPASNALGAYVAVTHTAMGWGLLLDNRSNRPWEEVEVVVNGEWIHRRDRVEPDEKVVLGPLQFSRGGEHPPAELSVESIRLHTRKGQAAPNWVP